MNTGIQILIARMKTNPEEWAKMSDKAMGRWESIVHLYWDYFTNEDKTAYLEARHEVLADEFSEEVLKILAGEETEAMAGPYLDVFSSRINAASINPATQNMPQINPHQNVYYNQKPSTEDDILTKIRKRMLPK